MNDIYLVEILHAELWSVFSTELVQGDGERQL